MALHISEILDAIAALTVTGLTILDADQIPVEMTQRDCPVLFPRPDEFITDFTSERQSFGPASAAARDVTYTLNFILAYAPVGTGRGIFEPYKNMLVLAYKVIDAIHADDDLSDYGLDVTARIGNVGLVSSPGGAQYHGCVISFDILELVN